MVRKFGAYFLKSIPIFFSSIFESDLAKLSRKSGLKSFKRDLLISQSKIESGTSISAIQAF